MYLHLKCVAQYSYFSLNTQQTYASEAYNLSVRKDVTVSYSEMLVIKPNKHVTFWEQLLIIYILSPTGFGLSWAIVKGYQVLSTSSIWSYMSPKLQKLWCKDRFVIKKKFCLDLQEAFYILQGSLNWLIIKELPHRFTESLYSKLLWIIVLQSFRLDSQKVLHFLQALYLGDKILTVRGRCNCVFVAFNHYEFLACFWLITPPNK
jgi:hypothetical protein